MVVRRDGPTPAGGVRSEAYMTDAGGRPTDDPAAAVAAEIVELDADGEVLARTQGRTDYPAAQSGPAGPDEHDHAGQWDVYVEVEGRLKIVDRLSELRVLHEADSFGDAVFRTYLTHLIVLPTWRNAPDRLKDEVYRWLEDTRPA